MVKEFEPGVPEPGDHAAVENLLRLVPDVAFLSELRASIPKRPRRAGALTPAAIDELADDAYRDSLRTALERLRDRAQEQTRGGLAFLARTLVHFLDDEPVSSAQHPLIVALFLRGEAAVGRVEDNPQAIAHAMDAF